MPRPSEVFRERLRDVRRIRGWTQQELAGALDEAGVDLGEFAITRLEKGKRSVSLDEAVAIAAVLGVSPLHMLVPLDDSGVRLAPSMPDVRSASARAWFRGQRPLRRADEPIYYTQTPPSEADWFPFVPGPWRSENPEDYEAVREKYESQIMQHTTFPLSRHPDDLDAVDIPPTGDDRK
jgi:transcriptional regulator with XRE-family HTH domain